MPYTEEPKGLAFINNINTGSLGSMTTNLVWLVGSLTLTWADYQMLTSATDLARQSGIFLAGILVTAWTGKTAAGVWDSNNKRKADPKYKEVLEAKERGQASGAAAALVLKQQAAAPVTQEHPVPKGGE